MQRIGNKVSYIKKPLAKASLVAAGLAAVSLLFGAAALALGYVTGGNAPLVAAALGFCSILTAASSLVYGIFSFLEREKNYILAKASLIAAGILVVLWLVYRKRMGSRSGLEPGRAENGGKNGTAADQRAV